MVYKIRPLVAERLFSLNFWGDTEALRRDIKSSLDRIYHEELEKKRRKKSLNDWDGYIDTQSKRDDKLNQILNP